MLLYFQIRESEILKTALKVLTNQTSPTFTYINAKLKIYLLYVSFKNLLN